MKEVKILYIAPFVDPKIKNKRGYSANHPAGNKKILGIVNSLNKSRIDVEVLSPLLLKNNTFKIFKTDKTILPNRKNKLYYPFTLDIKYFCLIITIISTLFLIIKWTLKNKNSDKIVMFYNYRLETCIPAIIARKVLNVALIVDYEDGVYAVKETNKYYKRISSFIEEKTKSLLDGGILVTSLLKDRIDINNYEVIRGIIGDEKIDSIKNREKHSEEFNIVYSGRLDFERGIEVLIDAIKYIKTSKTLNIIITGYGPLETKVKEFVSCYSSPNINIKFLGFVDDVQYKELMNNADIFINPQREKIEFSKCSFPSKILEYIQNNKLIISSNVSDIAEINRDLFLTYKSDNPEDLARSIDKAVDQYNSLYLKFPENALLWAKSNAAETAVSKRLGNLILNTLRKRFGSTNEEYSKAN